VSITLKKICLSIILLPQFIYPKICSNLSAYKNYCTYLIHLKISFCVPWSSSCVASNLCIYKIPTAPYRPQHNGTIEHMHRTLGAKLRKAASQGFDWVLQLPFAMFMLRASPSSTTTELTFIT